MKKYLARIMGFAAVAITTGATATTFTIFTTWDEPQCPESLLD